jgi:hypothetical protein
MEGLLPQLEKPLARHQLRYTIMSEILTKLAIVHE